MNARLGPREQQRGYPPEDPVLDFLQLVGCRHETGTVHWGLKRYWPGTPYYEVVHTRLVDSATSPTLWVAMVTAGAQALQWEAGNLGEEHSAGAHPNQLELPLDPR